jgi:hypothetical protein
MSEELTQEDVCRAIDALVEELLEEGGVSEPPVDAVALARHLGLEPAGERGRRGRARPEFVNAHEATPEQRQREAAIELAEHLHGDLLDRLGVEEGPRPMFGESLTRLFAERLLLPQAWLAGEARVCGYDLFELKGRFSTASHEAIAMRLLDLDQACIVTVVDNERVTRRRANSGNVGRELAPAEAACLRQVQKYSRPCRVSDGGLDVRGWPIHKADWKREILRSVIEE